MILPDPPVPFRYRPKKDNKTITTEYLRGTDGLLFRIDFDPITKYTDVRVTLVNPLRLVGNCVHASQCNVPEGGRLASFNLAQNGIVPPMQVVKPLCEKTPPSRFDFEEDERRLRTLEMAVEPLAAKLGSVMVNQDAFEARLSKVEDVGVRFQTIQMRPRQESTDKWTTSLPSLL